MKYNKMIQDFIEEWEFCPCNIRTNTLVGCFGMNDCKKCFYLRGITQDEIIDYIVNESKKEIEENKIEIESYTKKIESMRNSIKDCEEYISKAKNRIRELNKLKEVE